MTDQHVEASKLLSYHLLAGESVSRNFGSNLQNYSEYYDEWDNDEVDSCYSCHGTGLDDDEVYDCLTCAGEGEIPRSAPLTRH